MVLRLQGRAEVSTINYGKKYPCFQILEPARGVRSRVGARGPAQSQGTVEFPYRSVWQSACRTMFWHHQVLSSGWGGPYVPDRILLPYTQLLLCGGIVFVHAVWAPGRQRTLWLGCACIWGLVQCSWVTVPRATLCQRLVNKQTYTILS